ncbi:MAG TPA: hypothetical protein VN366_06660 [Feifaniaceae bacterium]|nr:hypothetical protein [Feifaniaceae bacterium]
MGWDQRIRDLWIDFLFWIRFYILSLMFQQRGLGYVASRTMRNATEFADTFAPFYGQENAKRFEELMTEHILLLSEYAAILKSGQSTEEERLLLYANANALAGFFASLNPNWENAKWTELLYQRFSLEESLLWKLKREEFRAAIEQFDAAHRNARQIAAYMVEGIAAQFQLPVSA